MIKKLGLAMFCLFWALSILPLHTQAQYGKKSDFLYGRSKSKLPYYVGLQTGLLSGKTFFNKDFNSYSQEFAFAVFFEKPLGYRPSLYVHARFLGNYTATDISRNGNADLTVKLDRFYDFSLNYSYLLFNIRGWDYRASLGVGVFEANVSSNQFTPSNESSLNYRRVTEYIIPLQLTTGRVLYKRFELELGYRYNHTTSDVLDLHKMKWNKDKYGFAFVGIKYLLGEKDYRFFKEGECPTTK
jgi:hypothetical protein